MRLPRLHSITPPHPASRSFIRLVCSLLFIAGLTAPREAAAAELVVQLRSEVSVTEQMVLLRDVAKITHRDPRKAAEAGELELAFIEDDARDQPLEISLSSVRILLVLEGWSNQQIQVVGAETAVVRFHERKLLTDPDVESAALNTMQNVMEIPAADIQVRLVNGFVEGLPSHIRQMDGVRVEVLPPLVDGPGQISMNVRLWHDDDLLVTRIARFDVLRRFRVAVARSLLRRDTAIDGDSVQFERRFMAVRVDEPADDEVIGRRPRSDIKAGEIISMSSLGAVVIKPRPILIKARDSVRVIAKSGQIQVTLQAAEALQSGREGDLIQVRNPDPQSKKVIVGRVTAAGEVEVRLR